jgi:hypothetical protein
MGAHVRIAGARMDTVLECVYEYTNEIGVGSIGVAVQVVTVLKNRGVGGGEVCAVGCWYVGCCVGALIGW